MANILGKELDGKTAVFLRARQALVKLIGSAVGGENLDDSDSNDQGNNHCDHQLHECEAARHGLALCEPCLHNVRILIV